MLYKMVLYHFLPKRHFYFVILYIYTSKLRNIFFVKDFSSPLSSPADFKVTLESRVEDSVHVCSPLLVSAGLPHPPHWHLPPQSCDLYLCEETYSTVSRRVATANAHLSAAFCFSLDSHFTAGRGSTLPCVPASTEEPS